MLATCRRVRATYLGGRDAWSLLKAIGRWNSSMSTVHLANGHAVQFFQSQPDMPSSAPTLVLFHGLASSHHCFKHMWPHLVDKYPIVAFDLPGTAGSDVEAAGSTYTADAVHQALAEAVKIVLDNTATQSVVFVGHSLGGHSALRLTHDFLKEGRQVQGLALLASAALEPYLLMRGLDLIPVALIKKYPNVVMQIFHLLGFADTHPPQEYTYGALRAVTTLYAVLRDEAKAIATANVPTLCVSAEDDPFLTNGVWSDLCDTLHAKVVRYPNGKHNLPKSKATDVARDLNLWIDDTQCSDRPRDAVLSVRVGCRHGVLADTPSPRLSVVG
ncbi:hypothetical protein H310_03488 [Aphanomyces invadans]|uniref:AB hydrolase-1 domain-containing protein n=1 Tax=Aphanomyces invadans TaxID=157072 RepID=A0A024UIX2_9STRA|nr:hypothetical protein H310_03488 [Aphanomyces invadans]ETW05807.1 hypothetical protein H310_03488 [Aphanomyces invadans]|eukprot:XP_008865584.1 hypothetical protein H310_03488 [Aphanomyces invadans]